LKTHPVWLGEARTPGAEECSIALMLVRRAAQAPDAPFALFSDGSRWSNGEALLVARETAAALAARGVSAGDRVVNWLPNSAAHLRVMLATALLGATPVPMNPALRGRSLLDSLQVVKPRLIVTHAALADRLSEMEAPAPCPAVVLGGEGEPLRMPADGLPEPAGTQPWDLGVILYTSGTTGGVKAVRVPNGQLWSVGRTHFGFLEASDRVMLTTPLCHIGPLAALMGAIMAGASVIVLEGFKTSTFWDDVRRFEATAVPGMGPSLLNFLNKAPAHPDDRRHGLRLVNVVAADAASRAFAGRFGVSFFPSFGMTELSVPIVGDLDSTVEGSCGRVRDGMEVRIVDAHDMEVPAGQVGEIVVRAQHPWTVNDGYEANPEATVAAWRNGWFHTGDAAWRDADGNVFFADRIKDVIRRRGENISSIEVEREVKAFAAVEDAAAIAVSSEHGDQEILVVVSPLGDAEVVPADLIAFLTERMPHFMVPRYVRVLRDMPRTPSNKIRKADLRRDGVTADTWDREAAGIAVRAQRFGSVA